VKPRMRYICGLSVEVPTPPPDNLYALLILDVMSKLTCATAEIQSLPSNISCCPLVEVDGKGTSTLTVKVLEVATDVHPDPPAIFRVEVDNCAVVVPLSPVIVL